jgi:ribosomal protein S18 acetylase RimI-like enzyme
MGALHLGAALTQARAIVAKTELATSYTLGRPDTDREAIAERILTALPRWFGRPASTAVYIRTASRSPMIAVFSGDVAVGFLTLIEGSVPGEREIAVIAIDPAHRRGLGTMMVEAALADCRQDGIAALAVQTLGPSHPDLAYTGTRAFYHAVGFVEVVETLDAWGPGTPSLLLRMATGADSAGGSSGHGASP